MIKGGPDGCSRSIPSSCSFLGWPCSSSSARLQIVYLLHNGVRNVGELAQLCAYTSANMSRHPAFLTQQDLVACESRGTAVYYRIADDRRAFARRGGGMDAGFLRPTMFRVPAWRPVSA